MRKIIILLLALALLGASAMADVEGSVFYLPTNGLLEISCEGLAADGNYSLLMLESDGDEIAEMSAENLVWIDQLAVSAAGELSVAFIHADLPECAVLLGGEFDGQESPILLGTLNPADMLGLEIPAMVTAISEEAFIDCAFRYVYVGDSVTEIGARAFKNCTDLQVIVIPDSVKTIAKDAFEGCEDVVIVCSEGSEAHKFAVAEVYDYKLR